jgi:DNA replication protein DnaC
LFFNQISNWVALLFFKSDGLLGDNTMSTTILDRLMHHCHLLEFDGRSYRLKEAAETLARNRKAAK